MTHHRLTGVLGAVLLGPPAFAQDDVSVPAAPVEVADDGHARISDVAGNVRRRGPFDAEDAPARMNELVREGDRLSAEDASRVEVEIRGGTFVRLGEYGVVVVERLAPDVRLDLLRGSVFVSRGSGAAPVIVRAGDRRVEVEAATVVRVDRDPEAGGDDALARWSEEREKAVRGATQPRFVTEPYVGVHDLGPGGTWIYVTGRWAWRPTVAADWRPYLDGEWAWVTPYGWTWIPNARWGYVTHHYGRWQWTRAHGWVWVPGGGWAPAWVVWAGFGVYLGWAPVDAYGRPVILTTTVSYYDPLAWCFARPSYFHARHRVAQQGHARPAPLRARAGPTEIVTLSDHELRALRPYRPREDSAEVRSTSRVVFREAPIAMPARSTAQATDQAPLPARTAEGAPFQERAMDRAPIEAPNRAPTQAPMRTPIHAEVGRHVPAPPAAEPSTAPPVRVAPHPARRPSVVAPRRVEPIAADEDRGARPAAPPPRTVTVSDPPRATQTPPRQAAIAPPPPPSSRILPSPRPLRPR
jgi:hypothetical protein